jgi:hypothetical protein
MDANSEKYALWSMILGCSYVYYMTYGFSLIPRRKPYNKLFDAKKYLIHLLGSGLVSITGLYLCLSGLPTTGAFMPIIFLLTFLIVDTVVQVLTGRHIIIATRWDYRPAAYKWYVDGLLGFAVFAIPVLSAGVALNWYRK